MNEKKVYPSLAGVWGKKDTPLLCIQFGVILIDTSRKKNNP